MTTALVIAVVVLAWFIAGLKTKTEQLQAEIDSLRSLVTPLG